MLKSRYEDVSDPQQSVEIIFDFELEKNILSDFCNDAVDIMLTTQKAKGCNNSVATNASRGICLK